MQFIDVSILYTDKIRCLDKCLQKTGIQVLIGNCQPGIKGIDYHEKQEALYFRINL